MTKTMKVDEAIVINLQRLSVEVDSRKELISFMINQGMDITGQKFKDYESEYQKYYFEYQQAKTEFEKAILRPEFGKENMLSWNLDFNDAEVTVELKD